MTTSNLPAPTTVDAAPRWRSGTASMTGNHLHIPTASTPIPLSQIDNILITDASYRKTPTWAIVLGIFGILFFLIGIVFFFIKETVPQSRITIYVKGNPGMPLTVMSPMPVGEAQTAWYPVLAALKASN